MSQIEVIIVLLLLLMSVPDLCRRLGRPALVYPMFVLFGLVVRPFVEPEVVTTMQQAGQVGFLLLLFGVGLEIELPSFRRLLAPLGTALGWMGIQFPLVLCLAAVAGLPAGFSLLSAAALTACSVGMAHPAWKVFPGLSEPARAGVLQVMVLLEVSAVLMLAILTPAATSGLSWAMPLHLVGISVVVFLLNRFARHLHTLFQTIIDRATRWRTHVLILLVLAVCALGERLGLAAPKTAFFLGLVLSSARHKGLSLEDYIAPISHRFLIPVFFAGLGLMIEGSMLFTRVAVLAVGTGMLLLGARESLQRRFFRIGGGRPVHLLLCPNLTIVALVASEALRQGHHPEGATWLLLSGMVVTVASVLLLPPGEEIPSPAGQAAPAQPEANARRSD